MKKAKGFILSSLWEDPGFVLIEAAIMKTFVLSSNCLNGPNEIIKDNYSGVSFENNDHIEIDTKPPLPHPSHYNDWFLYFDTIDLRRHLIDVEEVLIKAAIDKNSGHITKASESLKLNRTTLIEKMKKLSINQ